MLGSMKIFSWIYSSHRKHALSYIIGVISDFPWQGMKVSTNFLKLYMHILFLNIMVSCEGILSRTQS